ncbi:hypothetical protein [Sulfitobacter sp. S190]|uniref:hypothetical protein n=1 Tax=Sulfitobacter sp. S190 TaxID=2867022 RepID=UPI0021A38193|nr:hypothetical protein [Sulfitobacter sp. S190]UWR21689.1 hypothetical protein K3756_13475 [Sulfitobacter sp. S190]
MKKTAFLIHLAALGGFIALTAPALAQNGRQCGPRASVVESLAERYGESRQSVGLGANSAMVETFASSETGTWTITVTMPSGLTCLVASGQAFETVTEALPAKGEDA